MNKFNPLLIGVLIGFVVSINQVFAFDYACEKPERYINGYSMVSYNLDSIVGYKTNTNPDSGSTTSIITTISASSVHGQMLINDVLGDDYRNYGYSIVVKQVNKKRTKYKTLLIEAYDCNKRLIDHMSRKDDWHNIAHHSLDGILIKELTNNH